MSEMELYGLMAIAKEHQAAVERAAKGLDTARAGLAAITERIDQVRVEIRQVAGDAIRNAVAADAEKLAAPLRQATQEASKAATAMYTAATAVSWAWVVVALALGLLGGAGVVWWLVREDLQAIRAATYATWEQTRQPDAAKPRGK